LFEKYNHPPEVSGPLSAGPEPQGTPTPPEGQLNPNPNISANPEDEPTPSDQEDEADKAAETDTGDQGDEADASDENTPPDQAVDQPVEMTPEIDGGFAQLARERVARHPLRYYFLLPVRRAFSLWFDTHSQYYPFEGELLPFEDLDYDIHQQFWLPLFAILTLIYTSLGIAGGWFLWEWRELEARQWVLLTALMIFLRIGFFATLENPEPRYVVEVFPFLSILGGIALAHFPIQIRDGRILFEKRVR
jgi:hypothetical protein